MKKILKLFSLALALIFVIVALIACDEANEDDLNDKIQDDIVMVEKLSYISIRINPEVELIVDEEEKVVAVNAVNEDGEIVLSELSLLDLTAIEALELIAAKAIELGYIDVETEETIVYILTECDTAEEERELEDKLCEKVDKFFDEKGVLGKGCPEKLDNYKALAEDWGVSLKNAKLISRIMELYPEMTLEEILELTKKELCELVKDNGKKHGLPVQIRDEYKEKVEALKEEYAKYFELKKELSELEMQLKDETLSEEELTLVQAEYELKKAEHDVLKEQYKESLEQVKYECKEQIDKVKDEIKEEVSNRYEKMNEYKRLSEELGVSVSEVKMIKFILELNPEMTLEDLLKLSMEELREFFKSDNKKPDLPKDENEQKEELKDKFKEFYELKKHLAELEKQLENENLSEEELGVIKAEYEALLEEYQQFLEKSKDKQDDFKEIFKKWCDNQYKNNKGKK